MTEVLCVRVRPEEGEATRQALAERGLIDVDHKINVENGWLYIPVVNGPDDYTVVTHASPQRERQTMPEEVLGFDPSYERLGDIAILAEDDPDRARKIANALLASNLPIESVVNRASEVKGDLRVREWDVLVGDTNTVHREYGHEFALDIAEVYFSPRLATERHRVIEQVRDGEQFLDMFAGVGPFVIPAVTRGARSVGVDLNPVAIEFLRENARRNGVECVTAINTDVREIAYDDWADRLVMNLPHSANAFLDTAVRLAGEECLLHYYDIQHEDDPFGPGERAIRSVAEPTYEVSVETRHVVRSYAPHELNVCLDVRLMR